MTKDLIKLAGCFCVVAALIACGKETRSPMEHNEARPSAVVTQPRPSARVFISGHSLVDQPLPTYLTQIAESLGTPMEWNRQYVVGSSILRRTRGENRDSDKWEGYRQGYNRDTEGLDVIAEFAAPTTIAGGPYDVLLITEQHGMLETLIWNDTVRHLRHYHEQFIAGNPAGITYFYEPWISLDNKDDPRRWIEYERWASPIWQCMATRINVSLEHEGRPDRIVNIPAALAVATLVERAIDGELPGVSDPDTRKTVDRIVNDVVHLTELGVYYVSLISYAMVFHQSPIDAWAPAHIKPQTARALQQVAAEFLEEYAANQQPLTLAQCRSALLDGGIRHYWTYIRDAYYRGEMGTVRAYVRWARRIVEWRSVLSREDARNPFYFDPSNESNFWFHR